MPALALLSLLALTCARAELRSNNEEPRPFYHHRSIDTSGGMNLGWSGCLSSGRWYAAGVAVRVRDACLRCRCARAALSCARAACAPPPDPPPPRCALLHRRDACCPELHCPDGVRSLELEAGGARAEEQPWDVATPAAPAHACLEEGALYAAGSALPARAACERCFCLKGARRCVRPACLPPPPACRPRPAPGVCCPDRYYCDAHNATTAAPLLSTTLSHRPHDCMVNGRWVPEGEQVPAGAGTDNCSQCFCLRGALRCQPEACARPLRGCTPLLRPGHCCPHQYHCPHNFDSKFSVISANAIAPERIEERSLRSTSTSKSTAKAMTSTPAPSVAAQPATTKVKRKTNDVPPKSSSTITSSATTTTATVTSTTRASTSIKTTDNPTQPSTTVISRTTEHAATIKQPVDETSTEQPEGSVRVVINGTINCTAELSSSLHNITNDEESLNATEKILSESKARVPAIETQTSTPADIITRDPFAGDSFVVNVSSSLFTNTSIKTTVPPTTVVPASDISLTHNMSKKTKEDYDYDYTEPTLPPSLPNLKIIPFVAADAVVDEDEAPKDTYPMLEREDKFPVYYPAPVPVVEHTKIPMATRREDVYPVFVSGKEDDRPERTPIVKTTKPAPTAAPTTSTAQSSITTPEVNLFSPPAETEGGFIPKGPGLIEEYYAVYPRTPPPVPHLTTSMQINPATPDKMECVTSEGRHVPEGESVWVGCASCACAWGELHCTPRRCHTPPHCRRRVASTAGADICCGELICDNGTDNTTTPTPSPSTERAESIPDVSMVPTPIESELIPFDPPPDRTPPELLTSTTGPTANKQNQVETSESLDNNTLKKPVDKAKPTKPEVLGYSQRQSTSTLPTTVTSKTTVAEPSSTSTASPSDTSSLEYEDEEEDEGFSFGSVLKLLLSDSYGTSTVAPAKKKPVPITTTTTTPLPFPDKSRPAPPSPANHRPLLKPPGAVPPFVPVQPHAYIPPKRVPPLNRIDHLVLGESTAIKQPPRPTTTTLRSITSSKRYTTRHTTRKPLFTTSTVTTRVTKTEALTERYTSSPASVEAARVSAPSVTSPAMGGGGLLKLAGCNIYGRMYRVGRIITELSTPCQECRCTELGVQCAPLHC